MYGQGRWQSSIVWPHTAVKSLVFNPYAAGGWFGQYKMTQKIWKMTKTLANGYSYESAQQELSNEYQHDRVQMVIKDLCVIVLGMKIASALEGLRVGGTVARVVIGVKLYWGLGFDIKVYGLKTMFSFLYMNVSIVEIYIEVGDSVTPSLLTKR